MTTFTRFTKQLVKLTLDDDSSLETTGAHPFWVVSAGWRIANDLEPGMKLQTDDGLERTIVQISHRDELTGDERGHPLYKRRDSNYKPAQKEQDDEV